jgi:hypothetical protein
MFVQSMRKEAFWQRSFENLRFHMIDRGFEILMTITRKYLHPSMWTNSPIMSVKNVYFLGFVAKVSTKSTQK